MFRRWTSTLLPEIETIIVELPGRESRFHEPPYRAMGPMVADVSRAVKEAIEDDLPFAFFGNSMGSIVSFETLLEVRRQTGREATHLFVSAAAAPQCESHLPIIGHLEDEELIRAVGERYGAIPAPVLADKDFLASILPALRADIQLLEDYRFKPKRFEPLACPITAFGGKFDRTVPRDKLDQWREQTSGAFRSFFFETGHLYLDSARDFLLDHFRLALLVAEPAFGEGQ